MTLIPNLTDYDRARRRLLASAEGASATLGLHVHPERGPGGEELATDVARFGAPIGEARHVTFVISGVHGIEGHAGNGLQQLLVDSGRLASLAPGTAVVLVHAVNPYGMAWSRRVDHDNIDINRNFLVFDDAPDNPLYEEVDPLLNPTDPDLDPDDLSFVDGLLEFWNRVGDTVAMRTVSGGQYSHPAGVQYGGRHKTWSRQTLERIWSEHLEGAGSAVCLDIHTALGPSGQLTVFQTADETEASAELGAAVYPDHLWRADRTNHEPMDHGLLGPGFDDWAAGRLDSAAFVLEFGTHDPISVLAAFRADNWLHQHHDPRGARGQQVAQLMQERMFIDDETWRTAVGETGSAAIHGMLDAVETSP